jgi:hypothetical protein
MKEGALKMSSYHGDPRTNARPTIQSALYQTVERFSMDVDYFATRAGISSDTLLEFIQAQRSISATALQSILDALNTDQYQYFVSLLALPERLLQEFDPRVRRRDNGGEEDDLRTDAFMQLVIAYCLECSQEEQIELLRQIHEASIKNPNL